MKTNKFIQSARIISPLSRCCFFCLFFANQWIIKLINNHYCSSRVNYAHHNVLIPLNMETHHPSVIVKQCIWELKPASTVSHCFSKLYKQEAVEGKCCVFSLKVRREGDLSFLSASSLLLDDHRHIAPIITSQALPTPWIGPPLLQHFLERILSCQVTQPDKRGWLIGSLESGQLM